MPNQTAYDFSFENISGGSLNLSDFRGLALLVVNTASQCGFTSQYKGLEQLYQKYKTRGLVILGVPSNNFGGQEPGGDDEIKNFCESRFAVSFPMTAKIDIKTSPFYQWAGKELGFGTRPKWNFHKYLVDKQGNLVDHFHSTTGPDSERLQSALEKIL